MSETKILNYINKIKLKIEVSLKNKKYNIALQLISVCANILYSSNIYYYDADLENYLYIIAKNIVKSNYNDNSECIVFYDGFGLDFRGLAQIYLKALCNIGKKIEKKIIYITYSKFKNNIPSIVEIIINGNGEIVYIDENKEIDKILQLNNLIMRYKPKIFFFYSYPNDVIATTFLYAHKGDFVSYQINLTDHAFWLGANAFDYCIEFRDYGATVSKEKRNISAKKLIKLPFYPVSKETDFQGYPFSNDMPQNKIIFSGGSLYKTFGDDNKYYKIVRYILKNYEDVIFWYAGSGNRSEMEKLISEYPDRVFLTEERSDLVQVLKHSYIYLSTYPICGGLMFQYAALAGKISLTLTFDEMTDGFLINQKKLGIQFDNLNDFYAELDRLMKDAKYLHEKENIVSGSLITEENFENGLLRIIEQQKSPFEINDMSINYNRIHNEYLKNYKYTNFCSNIAIKRCLINFKLFPKEFIIGAIYKILKKLHFIK